MSAPRRNLELKAIDPDPAATLQAALAPGARDEGTLEQRDTYFHAVQGRLKLREAPPNPAELISYARADRPEALADVLGVRVVVAQRRVAELREALGIADQHLVARGYADMLERRGIVIPRRER